jgi:hypothetical protein
MPKYEDNLQRQLLRMRLSQLSAAFLRLAHPDIPAVRALTLPGERFRFERELVQTMYREPDAPLLSFTCAERDATIYRQVRPTIRRLFDDDTRVPYRPNVRYHNCDIVDIVPADFHLLWYDVCGAITLQQVQHIMQASHPDCALVFLTVATGRMCAKLSCVENKLQEFGAADIHDALDRAMARSARSKDGRRCFALGSIDFISGTPDPYGLSTPRTPFRVRIFQVGDRPAPVLRQFDVEKIADAG